jgi:P-type conjugative transfer protein TrbJ
MNKAIAIFFATAFVTPAFGQFTAVCVTGSATTGISPCASESTSVMQNVQLVLQYARQALQLAEEVKQTSDMLKNSARIGTTYNDVSSELEQLSRIASMGQAIAFGMSNIDARFKSIYGGYAAYSPINYGLKYALQSQTTLDSMQAAIRVAGLSTTHQGNVQGIIAALRAALNSADGRNGMISALAQIADAQNSNAHQMRALMTADLIEKSVYQSHAIEKEANDTAAAQRFFQTGVVKDKANASFGFGR